MNISNKEYAEMVKKATPNSELFKDMLKAFFDSILENKEMPIDIYDAVAWMVVTCLSEDSISKGGMPVEIPDFTSGKWIMRESKDVVEF